MADGSVKIDITADDSDVKKKLDGVEDAAEDAADGLDKLGDSADEATSKYKELTETIEKQEKELAELKSEYTQAIINFGKGSAEAKELEGKMSSLNSELEKNKESLGKAKSAADNLSSALDENEKSFGAADVAIGTFITNGLTSLVSKAGEALSSLASLSDETREYREDMAKLEAGFKSAGHSTETAQKAYDELYKILGESDRTVEAVNHLAELTTNTEDVAKWSTIAAGVTAKFGDSLPIEGLTEAANETAKVGAVTGPLADALNWAGISEDEFNEKLKACNSEQERATLITDTLSGEYSAAAAEYNKLTASTQAARDATNRMEQAQARLGAALEPVTTALTNIMAGALEWVAGAFTAAQSTDVLTESQRASVTAAHEAAEAYRETKEALFEMAQAEVADVDYATNYLIPQLQALVDSNGRVKEGYEERANFILGQLNEAYGTEYTRISEIIGANGQLKQSILDVIDAKKASILLEPFEESYKVAVQNVAEAEKARALHAKVVAKYVQEVEEAEKELSRVMEEEKDERGLTAGMDTANAQANLARKKKLLEDEQAAYVDSEKNLQQYYKDISAYQTASTLIMEGKTSEAVSYLNDLSAGYGSVTGDVQNATEEQRKALEEQVINTEINAQLMKEAYKNGVDGVTKEMVETAEEQAKTAKQNFFDIGGEITKGIANGAENEEWILTGAMRSIVDKAVKAAKDAAGIKSPSRLFRDEVGTMISAGVAVGIEQGSGEVVQATEGLFDTLRDVVAKEQKKRIKTVKDYNKDEEEEINTHNLNRAKLDEDLVKDLEALDEKYLEDRKKKGANLAKLEKKYSEDRLKINSTYDLNVEKENERHASQLESINGKITDTIVDKMKTLVELGETYKSDAVKIWEDLTSSVAEVQANYENQLASRTESIANSLNLWDRAGKNKTTGHELTMALSSQVHLLEDYNEAISKLEGRNIDGDLLNALKGLGVGATGEIETLAKMTDGQLAEYVKLWKQKNEQAKQAALEELEPLKEETLTKIEELTEGATLEFQNLRAKYQEEGALLMADLKQAMIDAGEGGYEEILSQVDEYSTAGGDLMDGVIVGIVEKSPAVSEAVVRAVREAIQAAKEEAGIHSPSKVMEQEIGYNLAEGVKVGWADKVASLKDAMSTDMQGITARVKAVVTAENARMAQGVGVRDYGISEVAQAVGMQTAGINSLASEYRNGASRHVEIPLVLDGRELGRAIVDLGTTETNRTGTSLSFA